MSSQRPDDVLSPISSGPFFFLAALHGMQDLSSLMRDRTPSPCRGSLNHWTNREVPPLVLNIMYLDFCKVSVKDL